MLLSEPFFKRFTKWEICDRRRSNEGLFAVSCGSRAEVDDIVRQAAVAAGGSHAMAPQARGFMSAWSFYDPDGHHWKVRWMNPNVDAPGR